MPCIMAQAGELLGGSVAEIVSEGFLRNVLASTKKKCTGQYLGESFRKYLGGRFGETPLEYLAFSSQENICARVSFFNKVAGFRPSYDTSVSL